MGDHPAALLVGGGMLLLMSEPEDVIGGEVAEDMSIYGVKEG